MLRALGATRSQVLGIVAAEALALGVAASALGIVLGLAVAKGLNALFDVVGFGIPRSGLILARTIALAIGVGVGVTLIAALVPAVRAMRVPPVAAIAGALGRDRTQPTLRRDRCGPVLANGRGADSHRGCSAQARVSGTLGTVAGGAVLMFVGVALSARYLVRPLASVIGFPIERAFHTTGRLARENAERNPGRTAVTSAALMVGLGLVVFVAVRGWAEVQLQQSDR